MLEAKKTNEGIVTSLADSDLVLAATSGGKFQPISVENLLKVVRDNIKVGGRNLLRNSDKRISTNAYQINTYYYGNDIPKVGENVIVTIWGQLGQGKSNFAIFNGDGDGTYGGSMLRRIADGVYQGNLIYIKEAYNKILTVFGSPQSVSATSTIERIKLERGNIPTDWSPAPEDLSGGVMPTDSIGYGLKKGGRHDRGENTHRRSYTLLLENGAVRGIACRDNAHRNDVPRMDYRCKRSLGNGIVYMRSEHKEHSKKFSFWSVAAFLSREPGLRERGHISPFKHFIGNVRQAMVDGAMDCLAYSHHHGSLASRKEVVAA